MRRCVAAGLLLLAATVAQPALGAGDPAERIVRLGADATAVLVDTTLTEEERRQRYAGLLRDYFDLPAIARFVLGRYWRQATPEQQRHFETLFEDYLLAVYVGRLKGYNGEKLEITGWRLDKPDDATVASRIIAPQRPVLAVDWRMSLTGDTWKVIDILVEGVSLSIAQRADFASVIRAEGGIDGLLRRLRGKIEDQLASADAGSG